MALKHDGCMYIHFPACSTWMVTSPYGMLLINDGKFFFGKEAASPSIAEPAVMVGHWSHVYCK